MEQVRSLEELRSIIGEPMERVRTKKRTSLTELDRDWLAATPFAVMATADDEGRCDASPKGDPAGQLVHVVDDTTIAIAERPGNRLADGYRNILLNPHVGFDFLIPGRGDTLRINGRAVLVSDADFFAQMVVKNHRPILAVVVEIEEIFFHCSKAFMRSGLWDPESWEPTAQVPERAEIAYRSENTGQSLQQLRDYYGPGYAEGLYEQ